MRSIFLVLLLACGGESSSPVDAGPAADATDFDAGVGVVCADVSCASDTQCCVEQINPPRPEHFCVPDVDPPGCAGAAFECDGPEDCADGEVCCSDRGSICAAEGTCQSAIVCHNVGDCPPFTMGCNETPLRIIRICG